MRYQGKDLRKGRHSQSGRYYHVTAVTHQRLAVFNDFITARKLIRCLQYADQQNWSKTQCFVVMPDHIHWLFYLGEGKSLDQLIKSVKNYSSLQCPSLKWQKGYHDHALRRDEDLLSIARYIVANPLRAGIVDDISTYPHWDSIWL